MKAAFDIAGHQSRPQCVLIVDDEPDHLRLLIETLRGHGLAIAAALTGTLGLRNARALTPDLILLDVNLPDTDGFALCRQLKQAPDTQDIPIIFLTGRLTVADKTQGFAAGGHCSGV